MSNLQEYSPASWTALGLHLFERFYEKYVCITFPEVGLVFVDIVSVRMRIGVKQMSVKGQQAPDRWQLWI
jgi:hypothetical protein